MHKERFQFEYCNKGNDIEISDLMMGGSITIPTKVLVEFVYGRVERALKQLRDMTPVERDKLIGRLSIDIKRGK